MDVFYDYGRKAAENWVYEYPHILGRCPSVPFIFSIFLLSCLSPYGIVKEECGVCRPRTIEEGYHMGYIKGIHHVCLRTSSREEYDKMYSFYHELLDLPVAIRADDAILFDTGSGIIEVFFDGKQPMPQGAIYHFALLVDAEHVDLVINQIREAGYPITMEPTDIEIPATPKVPVRCAFCNGPLGEEIEIFALR